ncbi:chromosomal replication initiator protein DnaA [Corynebacterium sp. 320]|uniref:chromosomal replication initiator protein DnaA n=1 Tax=Corynebacterium TaxID=1716 RepID=UPI00125CD2AD|nr:MULTISPECIES: chromosomal replication initiator protein DnaA [Corynebacterium]KAB1502805.1 chromosomal replication initiator protein DnaA [Corynebacterium sp. 320]KAB1550453.1 chromosomal replication initiator protein DnaA [Corynebacterium sp. 319]KAB1554816.1 chromosomal replication initiator protein DnaA [Corynebacterium sp. 321]KAB3526468.1 chromosomal replication initiator protein DnaA [Corynebacterium sp. 250]KAB3539788.1 chromosomal replication initiator protein DnaA [Corynebacterium 
MSNDQHADLNQHFPSIWTAIVQEWTNAPHDGSTSGYPKLSAKQRGLIRQIKALALVNTVAVFTAPTRWAKEEIERTLAPQIRDVLDQKLGMHVIMAISEEEVGSADAHGTEHDSADTNTEHTERSTHSASVQHQHQREEQDYSGQGRTPSSQNAQEAGATSALQGEGAGGRQAGVGGKNHNGPSDDPQLFGLPSLASEESQRGEQQALDWSALPKNQERAGHKPAAPKSSTPVFGEDGQQIKKNPNYPRLNADYTFERFVVGSSNQFAAAACRSVAEQPAKGFNPLFLWGESGLGKTHLLHAIAHYALELRPEMRVMYTSTEELTNDFINSIANDTREAFKRRYRSLDMLIVDDIQFLEGKESTQEEFFHTFNALHQAGKQIVLSSDRPPMRLTTLEDRLRTRFEGGLITDVTSPDLETRMAILTNKAKHEKMMLPEDVKIMIAERYDRSIRALEGALTRVIAYCSLENQEMSVANAKIALQDILPDEVEVNPQVVIEAVAEYFDLTLEELTGKGRSKHLVYARQIAMYLCRELTELSLPKLGASFGGRDHTTVMYAERRIRESITEDKKTFDQVQELLTRVKSRARA